MTRLLDSRSLGDRRRLRRYLIEFAVGLGAYVVALAAAIAVAQHVEPAFRWLLAALPLVPVAWIAVAVARHLGRADERQRVQTMQGLSIGFVAAMLSAVTAGLLGPFGLEVPGAPWWIYAAGMLAWLVATAVQRAR